MNFYLVCPELEFTLELPFSPLGREQVISQVRRMQEDEGQSRSFEYRLAEELSRLIPELTDWDIKPRQERRWHTQSRCVPNWELCSQQLPVDRGA